MSPKSTDHFPTFDLFASLSCLLGDDYKRWLSSPGLILPVRRSRPHPLTGGLRSPGAKTSHLPQTEEGEGEQGELRPEHLQILRGGGWWGFISQTGTQPTGLKPINNSTTTITAQRNLREMPGETDNWYNLKSPVPYSGIIMFTVYWMRWWVFDH